MLDQLQSSAVIETTKCGPEAQASSSVTCRYLWHCNSFHVNIYPYPLWILPIPVCELFCPTKGCCSSCTCTWRPSYQHLTPMAAAFSDLTSLTSSLHDTISLNYDLRHCPSFNTVCRLCPQKYLLLGHRHKKEGSIPVLANLQERTPSHRVILCNKEPLQTFTLTSEAITFNSHGDLDN